jgi:2,3-bisphosphoglycerate-independent phosphoglycerate mutase
MNRKVILMIMDGWGIAKDPKVSAVDAADTPFYDRSLSERPHSKLQASEEAVGLPEGQMGNSEVGHMNIGAGRVVYQELVRITKSIREGEIIQSSAWERMVGHCMNNNKPLHLMGLLSDGGVHSHIGHLKGILKLLADIPNFPPVYVHAFLDGRDTDPHRGLEYMQELMETMKKTGIGEVASITGRYWAMDRDRNFDRVAKAYHAMVNGKGKLSDNPVTAIQESYELGKTDEFMEPVVITGSDGKPVSTLAEGDAVLFFNFRTDRGRQLTEALTQAAFSEFNMHPLNLHLVTMTRYDERFKGVDVLFGKENIGMGLGETLAMHGKTQIRIAETEKYPHVTFFFNGGREEPYPGEHRILCASPKVATYDLKPEMSALEIRDKICLALQEIQPDFVCLNFANPDMVGHTGVWEAAVKACETVDSCVQSVVETALPLGYTVLVTADHGNADCMKNPDGSPHTAHTTALVPLVLHHPGKEVFRLKDGKLGDLAPSILSLMGVPIPVEMSGNVIIEEMVVLA